MRKLPTKEIDSSGISLSAVASNLSATIRRGKSKILAFFVFYSLSFFLVFYATFDVSSIETGDPTLHGELPTLADCQKNLLGPTPNPIFCEPHTLGNAIHGQEYYIGNEWPFIVYWPLVQLYNHFYALPALRRLYEHDY